MSTIEYRALVSVEQHNIALLFTNYLMSIDIQAKIEVEIKGDHQQFVIYCQLESYDRAISEFELFIKAPYSPKYQQAAWDNAEVSQVSQHGVSLFQSFKEQFIAHAGIVTLTIFIVCWLVFLGAIFGFGRALFSHLQFYSQLSIGSFIEEPIRIIGPALFHFSWLHIVFNTMWWWQLGGSIEKIMGKWVLINIFLLAGIISNLAQFIVSGANFGGLSGVVYALVGYVWWMSWLAPQKGLVISNAIVGFLLFWILLGFVDVLPVNMANTAHLTGLVCGCLLAVFNVKFTHSSN